MSYGIILKNALDNTSILNDDLTYYPTTRNGYSTSDPIYFDTVGFSAKSMTLNFDQFAGITSAVVNYSSNIPLNDYKAYICAKNLIKPTVVKICNIYGFETGLGATHYSSGIQIGNIIIKNFSDPDNLYSITNAGINTSSAINSNSFIISSQYFGAGNFGYVSDNENNIFLLAYPNMSSNASWIQIPEEQFYYYSNYFITLNDVNFNGKKLNLSNFNKIVPKVNETILISNSNNDTLSGVYSISMVSDYIYLKKNPILFNYAGQIFSCYINLDNSNNLSYNSCVYYVPYEYGSFANTFSKPLQLTQYTNALGANINTCPPLASNSYFTSELLLPLEKRSGLLNKSSDAFRVGVFVSNFAPDNSELITMMQYSITESLQNNFLFNKNGFVDFNALTNNFKPN